MIMLCRDYDNNMWVLPLENWNEDPPPLNTPLLLSSIGRSMTHGSHMAYHRAICTAHNEDSKHSYKLFEMSADVKAVVKWKLLSECVLEAEK